MLNPDPIPSPGKWHGGKAYLARRIVGLMRPHTHYVEPFAGMLSVLFAKDPSGVSEVVNDIDGGLTNFWRVLQGEGEFARLQRRLNATPFSEAEWLRAERPLRLDDGPDVSCAVAFFVRCRQSLAGRMESFAPLSRRRTRRGMNEQASAWLSAIEGLPAVHERLKRVVILNRTALEVIRQQDGPDTLFYLDPPYLPTTRAAADVYRHEMTLADHLDLLELLAGISGRFLLSGYRNDHYDDAAESLGWRRVDFDLPNNAASGEAKRRMTESVWTNFAPPAEGSA